MTDDPNNTAPAGAPPAEPRPEPSGSRRRWIVGAALAVVLVVLVLPFAFAASPRQCAGCHEMRPYYDSWQSSSHRAAASNCLDCHVRPGIVDRAGFELRFYAMVAGHFSGAQVETTAVNAPVVESCSRPACHSLNRETSNSGDLKINHRLHVTQANIPCTRCHPGAVHAGVGGRLKLPPMQLCKQCHADKMKECGYCHSEQRLQAPPGGH